MIGGFIWNLNYKTAFQLAKACRHTCTSACSFTYTLRVAIIRRYHISLVLFKILTRCIQIKVSSPLLRNYMYQPYKACSDHLPHCLFSRTPLKHIFTPGNQLSLFCTPTVFVIYIKYKNMAQPVYYSPVHTAKQLETMYYSHLYNNILHQSILDDFCVIKEIFTK